MTGLTIPLILAGVGLIAAIAASRLIRRGAARFYALERDAMLRRAVLTLSASVLLFVASIGILVNTQMQLTASPEDEAEAETNGTVTIAEPTEVVIESLPPRATEASIILSQPPTISAEPTLDLTLPTAEPTPVIIRGVIEGTAGSGANLREGPSVNSAELEVLDDGTIVTLIEGSVPVEANNFTWVNIRTGSGTDGWVVDIYVSLNNRP